MLQCVSGAQGHQSIAGCVLMFHLQYYIHVAVYMLENEKESR